MCRPRARRCGATVTRKWRERVQKVFEMNERRRSRHRSYPASFRAKPSFHESEGSDTRKNQSEFSTALTPGNLSRQKSPRLPTTGIVRKMRSRREREDSTRPSSGEDPGSLFWSYSWLAPSRSRASRRARTGVSLRRGFRIARGCRRCRISSTRWCSRRAARTDPCRRGTCARACSSRRTSACRRRDAASHLSDARRSLALTDTSPPLDLPSLAQDDGVRPRWPVPARRGLHRCVSERRRARFHVSVAAAAVREVVILRGRSASRRRPSSRDHSALDRARRFAR